MRLDGGNQCTGVSLGWKSYQMHGLQRCRKGSRHETHCLAWEVVAGGLEKCTIPLTRQSRGRIAQREYLIDLLRSSSLSIAYHAAGGANDVSLSYMYD